MRGSNSIAQSSIARYDQGNESSYGCDLGERSAAKSLGRERFG